MARSLKKILVVEDEEDIRAIIQIALEDVGQFSLKLCSSGSEALREVPGFQPDLILLDMMMPEMDGEKVLLELRKLEQSQETPVIFITAKLQSAQIAHFLKLGALDVIHKPFDPMHMADSIRKMWAAYNVTLLGRSYTAKLPNRVKTLTDAWSELKTEWSEKNLVEFQRLAHNLAGSAATFGYLELSSLVMQIEDKTSFLLKTSPVVAERKMIESLLLDINKMVKDLTD